MDNIMIWQKEWHKILKTGVIVPPELDCDFDVLMGWGECSDEQLKACFTVLPCGEKVLIKLLEHWSKKDQPIQTTLADDEILALVETQFSLLKEFVIKYNSDQLEELEEDFFNQPRKIYRGDEDLRCECLGEAEAITEVLEMLDPLWETITEKLGNEALEGICFLREVLYAEAGNSPVLGDWASWQIVSEVEPRNPHQIEYELSQHGIQLGWAAEEIVIFVADES